MIPNEVSWHPTLCHQAAKISAATSDRSGRGSSACLEGQPNEPCKSSHSHQVHALSTSGLRAISLEMPPCVFKALEKIFKAFLWTGSKVVQRGNAW
jgi:hypothetical protein